MTSRYAIKTLEKALRIYTPSLSEKALADILADRCDDLGFRDIHQDEVGNLIATKGSGEPKILLCGHMDVVPGKIKVRREGNMLHGRGASDAKAPLIAMLFAAANIKENQGTVTFVGAVDEEGNATGIKNLVKNKPDVDYAIFGEPSSIEKVTIAYKGRLAIDLMVNVGDSAHASAPWLAKNAIEETSSIVTELKNDLEDGQQNKTKGMMLTATLTKIRGGTSHNVTPIECVATLDIRIPVDMNCNDVEAKITTKLNEISKTRKIKVLHSVTDETEPFEAAHNSPLVRAITLAVIDIEKKRPMLIRKTGTGDMNVIGNQLKIPVITYGPGDPHEAHTIDEKISLDEFVKGIEILNKSLYHLKRLHYRKKKCFCLSD